MYRCDCFKIAQHIISRTWLSWLIEPAGRMPQIYTKMLSCVTILDISRSTESTWWKNTNIYIYIGKPCPLGSMPPSIATHNSWAVSQVFVSFFDYIVCFSLHVQWQTLVAGNTPVLAKLFGRLHWFYWCRLGWSGIWDCNSYIYILM